MHTMSITVSVTCHEITVIHEDDCHLNYIYLIHYFSQLKQVKIQRKLTNLKYLQSKSVAVNFIYILMKLEEGW